MSNPKKIVKITEDKLVDMINDLVTEVLGQKKTEWLAEQAEKGDKTAIMETRLLKLEETIKSLAPTK